jgi:uncharacterized protein YqjF (DUF2071 family)
MPRVSLERLTYIMAERPFLTAHWTDLLLLNFPVPAEVLARHAPAGTEPDLYHGQAYLSIVGFRFHTTRLLGLPVPGHTRFPEINLRYYVRRTTCGETRRGVVFVREVAPRRAVALMANWLYHENYIARPMRTCIQKAGDELNVGDTVEYSWATRCPRPMGSQSQRGPLQQSGRRWNRLAASLATPVSLPRPGSIEEYFVENYWGYVRRRDGTTHEYRVIHTPWRVAAGDDVTWDCDLSATYNTPLAEYLAAPPTSAFIADGSAIQLYRGRRCDDARC